MSRAADTAIGRSWQKDRDKMKVLTIGGTGFVSYFVVEELVSRGHEVTIFHRGKHEAEHSQKVRHIHGDRKELLRYKDLLLRMAHKQFVVVNSVRLAYIDFGGNGAPLLALHGHYSCGRTFAGLAEALGQRWRVVALDQRGHGKIWE